LSTPGARIRVFLLSTFRPVQFSTAQPYLQQDTALPSTTSQIRRFTTSQKKKQENSLENSEDRYQAWKAEKFLLESFWEKQCLDEESKRGSFCLGLQKKIDAYNGEGIKSDWDPLVGGAGDVYIPSDLQRDDVVTKMGSTLSSFIHHLVLPPSALLNHPFFRRVQFHIYLVKNHDSYAPFGGSYFSYERFKSDLSALKLPGQEFSFALKEISLHTDTDLALALKLSTRSALVPKLSAEGHYTAEDVLFLDSTEIRHHLQFAIDSSRHIPVFFFSYGKERPVLIDKKYQTKALDNVVLIVQSDHHIYESSIGCNGNPVHWNLRDPIKPALAATSTVLAGLVSSHIDYNDATGGATQDWMWSIGNNPFSYTSSGHQFSQVQKDIALRNYVAIALNDSIYTVNQAIHALTHLTTSSENFGALQYSSAELTAKYELLIEMWSSIASFTSILDPTVVQWFEELDSITQSFMDDAQETLDTVGVYRCLNSKEETILDDSNFDWLVPIALAVDMLIILALLLVRTRPKKVKIN